MFPAEPVPDRIGAYEILKRVGKVGTADVYSARMQGPLEFTREVTLKLVPFGVEEDARTAEELGREALICARLNHPVVVRMFDFFEHDRRLVLVLEQVEGASLDRLLSHLKRRKQTLSDHSVFFIAAQIASALAHAHATTDEGGSLSPIIHRDIKPENVMIGWDGSVRLSGFGLGKILGRTPDSVAGTVRGTPGYMAPEQVRGERATVRSDVYGLGVLLWAMLTGQEPPLDGVRPTPIAEARPDLPRELHAAIDAALEPATDKRRITCADLAQWLIKLAKIETGREELRNKVLWLRAARGPAGKLDATAKPPRGPHRRQAIQASRPVRRLSSRPPSGWPKSSRSRPSTGAPPPSARPVSVREGSGLLRIPPPPNLPEDAKLDSSRSADGFQSIDVSRSLVPRPSVRPQSKGSTMPPSRDLELPRVNVRTVSAPPPPRTLAPGRKTGAPDPASALEQGWPVELGAPRLPTFGAPPASFGNEITGQWEGKTKDSDLPGFVPPDLRAPELSALQSEITSQVAVPTSTDSTLGGSITSRPTAPSNTFPLAMQIILATLTAALVVALGLLLLRKDQTPPAPQIVTVEVARNQEPPRREAPPVEQPPPPLPAPVAPTPDPNKGGLPGIPDATSLGDNLGYLVVKGPSTMDVYLNGQRRGPTNEPLAVPCGHFFLRLAPAATEAPRFPTWYGPGQSVFVACRSATVMSAKLPPAAPEGTGTVGL
jgi:serine/threonine-protein kinase